MLRKLPAEGLEPHTILRKVVMPSEYASPTRTEASLKIRQITQGSIKFRRELTQEEQISGSKDLQFKRFG
jgi:hypothetical protein